MLSHNAQTPLPMSYLSWDVSTSARVVQDLLASFPRDSTKFRDAIKTDAQDQRKEITDTTSATTVARMDDAVTEHDAATDAMAMMNESANTNLYIQSALAREGARILKLDDDAKKSIYKVRQEYMYAQYMVESYRFMTRVLMFTMIATLILLTMVAAWLQGRLPDVLFYILTAVALFVYAAGMIVVFQDAGRKRSLAWDKYNWRPSDSMRAAITADDISLGSSCTS